MSSVSEAHIVLEMQNIDVGLYARLVRTPSFGLNKGLYLVEFKIGLYLVEFKISKSCSLLGVSKKLKTLSHAEFNSAPTSVLNFFDTPNKEQILIF